MVRCNPMPYNDLGSIYYTPPHRFYVYVYLDPRKLGKYCYKDFSFLYEPFYIGKGTSDRYLPCAHTDIKDNIYLANKINKIGKRKVLYDFIAINLEEKTAYDLEEEYIDIIGKNNDNKGPLCNIGIGGRRSSGWTVSKETRKKISQSKMGHKGLVGEDNPASKITKEIAQKIRFIYNNFNISMLKISKDLNLSYDIVKRVIHRTYWKHV